MNDPQISIPSFTTEALPKPHTVYIISIRLPLRSFSLKKRYSDFTQLHADLTSAVGIGPPASIPPKTFFRSTVSDTDLAEERRKALEQYLLAIQSAQDSRWRDSPPWRQFLTISSSTSNHETSQSAVLSSHLNPLGPDSLKDPVLWLDTYREMKGSLQDARSEISRRDQSFSTVDQHDASAAAKKALTKVSILLDGLEKGLGLISKNSGSGLLGDGEIRRRKDLLTSGVKERDALDALANNVSTKKLYGEHRLPEATVVGTALRPNPGRVQNRSVGRVLGAPMPETEHTRQLDNSGVLQLQQEIMRTQDEGLEMLLKAVGRQKQLGLEIGNELDDQNEFLDELGDDVDRYDEYTLSNT
ncbi:Syntaxin-52 [Dactylella cylindrospora]|nr:Syntaxin-52 [Dactylella cylindrospora]